VALCDPNIDDSIRKFLLENFSCLSGRKIPITGYDAVILSSELDECTVMS
jgi:hypothetical protein